MCNPTVYTAVSPQDRALPFSTKIIPRVQTHALYDRVHGANWRSAAIRSLLIGTRLQQVLPRDLRSVNHIKELARGLLPSCMINLSEPVSLLYPGRWERNYVPNPRWHQYSGAGCEGPRVGPSRGHSRCRSLFARGLLMWSAYFRSSSASIRLPGMHGKGDEALVGAVDCTASPPKSVNCPLLENQPQAAISHVVVQFKPALAIPYAGAI